MQTIKKQAKELVKNLTGSEYLILDRINSDVRFTGDYNTRDGLNFNLPVKSTFMSLLRNKIIKVVEEKSGLARYPFVDSLFEVSELGAEVIKQINSNRKLKRDLQTDAIYSFIEVHINELSEELKTELRDRIEKGKPKA